MPSASLQHRRRGYVGGGNHELDAIAVASNIADNNIDVCNSPNSIINNRISSAGGGGGGGVIKQRRRRKRQARKRFPFVASLLLGGKLIMILATLCAILLFCSYRMNIAVHRQVNDNEFQTTSSLVHLPIPNVDIVVPNATEWPLIHIVNTRFMQEQGALETLGMARLHLFLTFCFPTMINQSIQNWFWIIKTDPKFTTTNVFQKLIKAVEEFPNIYVVASNRNYLINPQIEGCWRDGLECMDLLRSKIYSGNITQLHQAIALRNERPILETRLDADDGLHKYYMQYIQWAAVKKFKIALGLESEESEDVESGDVDGDGDGDDETSKEEYSDDTDPLPPARWLYWCTRRHLEWHSSLNKTTTLRDHNHAVDLSAGILNPVEHSKLCVTPGITVGYNVGVDAKDVPVYPHNSLLENVGNTNACYYGDDNSEERNGQAEDPHSSDAAPDSSDGCVDLVERLLFCALRSRTWTSAGMRNVGLDPRALPGEELMIKLWELLEERFTIDRMRASVTQSYLIDHQKQIAYENLLGQCTSGHSCKEDAKKELRRIIVEGKQE